MGVCEDKDGSGEPLGDDCRDNALREDVLW